MKSKVILRRGPAGSQNDRCPQGSYRIKRVERCMDESDGVAGEKECETR